jgi:hypothetical protein
MKIEKKKDHVLFTSNNGTYHLELDKFNEMGEEKAIKFVEEELKKKAGQYTKDTISFEDARDMGFCEYGIKEFCSMLSLNIDNTYSIKELSEKMTKEAFLEYPNECLKLFGNRVFDLFGGPKKFLSENRTSQARNIILNSTLLTDKQKHTLACDFAESTLPYFEKEYPEDKRPRNAIETKRRWIEVKFGSNND